MAFVVCALIMYLLWWHKPFGVESRASVTVITCKENVTRAVTDSPRLVSPYSGLGGRSQRVLIQKINFDQVEPDNTQENQEFYQADLTWDNFFEIFINDFSKTTLIEFRKALGIMMRNVFGNPDFAKPPREKTKTIVFYATGTLFSALHIAAWNWEFPSSAVRELWRIFAITAAGTGPVIILITIAVSILDMPKHTDNFVIILLFFFLPFVYAASRMGLMVLIFYCFSSMPAGVYETVNWVQFLPHFS